MTEPYLEDNDFTLYVGDVREILAEVPDASVDCVVTSPPYWGLRDYGTGSWVGGNPDCDHRNPATVLGNTRRNLAEAANRADGGNRVAENRADHEGEQFKQYRDVCGKCGATRQDQQLGLEPTPDQYVENMVAVFREVRRVLADHGTCWVNLGDSYGSGTTADRNPTTMSPPPGSKAARMIPASWSTRSQAPRNGLKAKDLVGIPWRVARALQEPYYTGEIKDETDRVWLAATIEAEGCMFIHRRKAGTDSGAKFTKKDGSEVSYARKQDTFGAGLEVASTDRVIVERCMAITGIGSICEQTPEQNPTRKQTIYRWNVRSNECRWIIRELYPHLLAKKHEARLLLGCPSSGDDARKAWASLKALHQGQSADIDFREPEGMWEEGWFLRSDIIWAKFIPNPMPESVTDRPTKSHEYVFLLSKRPRYWFDAGAVREPADPTTQRKTVAPNAQSVGDGFGMDYAAFERHRYPVSARNVRTVWEIPTQPYPEAHFATYPEELVRRCLLAGCPLEVCRICGVPRERIVERLGLPRDRGEDYRDQQPDVDPGNANHGRRGISGAKLAAFKAENPDTTVGWSDCGHQDYRPGVVLDPFLGSGTTAAVARKHGRHTIGIELNPAYAELAAKRTRQLSLLA